MHKSFQMKSVILTLLTVLAMALLFMTVSCKSDVESGNYRVSRNGELSVIDKNAVPKEVVIPSEVAGRKVTAISKEAFRNCRTVEKITIGSGIVTLGEYAFADCPNLWNVIIPDSVEIIPANVFDGSNAVKNYLGGMTNAGVFSSITADGFSSKVIEGSRTTPVLVKFGAYWCTPCNNMELLMPAVADAYEDRLNVYSIDVDDTDNPDLMYKLMNQYNIMNIPALFLFVDGEVIWKTVGMMSQNNLIQRVGEQLQKAGK